ncbi:MAG TPA: glycosyltransferase family A protein [Pseudolysinimonas sp.]|nr:glycosyltransferase family A protein [Pseudolysinimonas sp.]
MPDLAISVVIPVRNDAAMLATALDSLRSQHRRPDEIIVVDNGSSDASAAVARDAGARVVPEPVRGIPSATATGYDAARGDIIARIDADSVCRPDWLARIERRFRAEPDLDLLTGDARFYGSSELVHRLGEALYIGGMYWAVTPYLGHPPVFGSNFAMRRDVWLELADEVHRENGIHDDLDLSLHVKPWMRVALDRELVVEISARPFATFSGFARRISWVVPTVRNHWPEDSPWARRAARREWEREGEERTARA